MLKDQILELRAQGKSYKEISEILHCSKSTVNYWCSPDGKQKVKERKARQPQWWITLQKKVDDFKRREKSSNPRTQSQKDWQGRFLTKIKYFKELASVKVKNFTAKSLLDSIKDPTKMKCYLTGRNIDITKDDYHLDHIMPVSKGGSSSLDNLGITCPQANMSKSDMTIDEYLSLCKEVLENFGYTVTKEE